jgi:acyl transferase domain-containing protein
VSEFLKRIADFSPKRLLLLAAELEERVRELEGRSHAPIAIVGMGCRFPGGVRDADSFWELLAEGRDAITEVPKSRWNVDELYDANPHAKGKVATRWGGFLDSPELFDPAFFGIAPIEAAGMDPQQRLLLEVAWEALEDAAIAPASLNGSRTGVFVGLCNSDYANLGMQRPAGEIDAYFAQGASHAVASGRISYFLGLRGPSLSIDTACSSSLVAAHEACQSLRLGESDIALAAGANLLFSPEVTMALSRAQMMAADGRCKAFSASANGFVRSEGCGVVVLKRLEDAERAGDRILAVIRGTALNQDGRSSGLTAPNGPSQEEVIRAALADAGIAPEAVSYVEAHGTGTSLGDTIEMQALGETVGKGRAEEERLPVGSVKSNFGHAESAAGVAGLIKLVLSLQKRIIPASLHCLQPNPKIDWESNRTRVPIAAEPWRPAAGQSLRIASVSSFGFSGTNAHLVVTEPPHQAAKVDEQREHPAEQIRVVTLSARSEAALKTMSARLADKLREQPGLPLADVAYTLAIGRSAFAHRAAIRPQSNVQLIEELALLAEGESHEESGFSRGVTEARPPRVAFLFAGQGGERTGMGLSLLRHSEVFRAAVSEVDAALTGVISTPIQTIFRNEHSELSHSALVQPALYAFQYGLARVWQSWGIEPHIVVGHSMGELVAATIAGVLSLEDAARLVAARGRLTGELGDPGGMVAVNAPKERVQELLKRYEEDVSIAAINGAASVVISGRSEAVELATQEFERAGVRVKRLNITYGSHSPAMHRVLPAFYEEAVKAQYRSPRMPIIADLTGELVQDASVLNAQYWTGHLSRPVQFARCLERLEKEGCSLCIEMGPRAVLTAFGKERGDSNTHWIASANGREDDFEALQSAVAGAFTAGATLDWKKVFAGNDARKVALPTYPFERERYWFADEVQSPSPDHPIALVTRRVNQETAFSASGGATVRLDTSLPIFERPLESPLPFHLDQHRVGGCVVLPASAYLSLAWEAAEGAGLSLENPTRIMGLEIARPLQPEGANVTVQTVLTPLRKGSKATAFHISSRRGNEEKWTLHASGELVSDASTVTPMQAQPLDRGASQSMSGNEFYELLEARGVHLGAAFRCVQELWYEPGTALGKIVADDAWHATQDHASGPAPALLDACFQVLGAAGLADGETQLRLMTGIEDIRMHGVLRGEMFVEARLTHPENDSGNQTSPGTLDGSIDIRDAQGALLVSVSGIKLKPIAALESLDSSASSSQDRANWLYQQVWEPMPLKRANDKNKAAGVGSHWMILGNPKGLAEKVHEKLSALGETAAIISESSRLNIQGILQSEIVDLRPIEYSRQLDIENNASADIIAQSTNALTTGSIELWQQAIAASSNLWLFTEGAQNVHATIDVRGAIQAPLWGLARCVSLEHPQRLGRVVDLDPSFSIDEAADLIVSELTIHDIEEQVAYNGTTRLAYRIKHREQPDIQAMNPRKDGSYLLTGGVGGLGLRVAAWLAQRGAGKLILTTRSLASVAARQAEIDAIRASGADLTIVQADVADENAMRRLFERFESDGDLYPLRGIVHMAADLSAAPIEEIKPAQVQLMFRPKVTGTLILHELTREIPLDFFAAFSSTAAVLGASGLAHYAAANSFVDAMASLRAAEGLPFISINWGTWQTMRLASEEAQRQYSSGGMLSMADDAALAWLGNLLQSNLRQATVANIDWQVLAPLFESKRQRNWLAHVRPQHEKPEVTARPLWNAEPGESRLSALERAIQKEAARVLGLRRGEVPGRTDRLADLGLDSLMAVTLRNRLQLIAGHGLPPTFAFEFPTAAEMASAIDMLLWGSGVAEEEHSTTERDEIQI